MAAGTLGITPGGATASVDNIDIFVHGGGGHGAQPQATKDPPDDGRFEKLPDRTGNADKALEKSKSPTAPGGAPLNSRPEALSIPIHR